MQKEIPDVDKDANSFNFCRSRQFLNHDLSRERSIQQSQTKNPVGLKRFCLTLLRAKQVNRLLNFCKAAQRMFMCLAKLTTEQKNRIKARYR